MPYEPVLYGRVFLIFLGGGIPRRGVAGLLATRRLDSCKDHQAVFQSDRTTSHVWGPRVLPVAANTCHFLIPLILVGAR